MGHNCLFWLIFGQFRVRHTPGRGWDWTTRTYSHGAFPRHRYTLTTGRSALTDAKAWLGATTMTDEAVLAESDRRYQMRLSR